jgi:lipopolysaccharide transport system ATP-binding protein
MNDIAIRVENLSKRYVIGGPQERYQTLRDTLTSSFTAPARALRRRLNGRDKRNDALTNEIWALRDLSLEIKHGEVVGIIGRNGAGKSTLLKILSRITEPTEGFAEVYGRVGSLLEVGTGFHHELTGRENIFLNGAIIGMRKAEIERKFDEIVAFAEIEKFIDTPVKRYSSGMYLRLAFSVAAHLEPEILLVDEVLAVGDIAFQRKCLGKMEDVAAQGRTVLFVSHNLAVIKELCQTGVVLKNGKLDYYGPVVEGLARYSQSLIGNADEVSMQGTGWRHITINGRANESTTAIDNDNPFTAEAWLDLQDEFKDARLFCIINNSVGDVVVHQKMYLRELCDNAKAGRYRLQIDLPALWFAPGIYTLYFKFLGTTSTGVEARYFSERLILDVNSDINGFGRAQLAPPMRWTFTSETAKTEPEKACVSAM